MGWESFGVVRFDLGPLVKYVILGFLMADAS